MLFLACSPTKNNLINRGSVLQEAGLDTAILQGFRGHLRHLKVAYPRSVHTTSVLSQVESGKPEIVSLFGS